MSLLRSICCLLEVVAVRKNLRRPQRRCDVKPLMILAKGKRSEKEPAKTNFDAWRAAQPALLGRVRIRVLNLSSTCRLVDFLSMARTPGVGPARAFWRSVISLPGRLLTDSLKAA